MGHVGHEALLQFGELVVSRNGVLQRGRHRVEGSPQVSHLIVAANVNAHIQVPLRGFRRGLSGDAHGQEQAVQERKHADR